MAMKPQGQAAMQAPRWAPDTIAPNDPPLPTVSLPLVTSTVMGTNSQSFSNGDSISGNQKAEVFALAHRGRVEAEAAAFLDAGTRKAEAHAQTLQARAEQRRMRHEARALERRKGEEQRAGRAVQDAKVRAEKMVAKALEDEVRIKARAHEEAERAIADARTRAEREKAEAEETRKRVIAELNDRAQQLVAVGALPSTQSEKANKVMNKLINRHPMFCIS